MSVEGWVITKDHLEDGNGRFPGQTDEEADATQKSFEGVFGRTVHISRGELTLEQIQDPVRFQVLDDDGELYCEGVCSRGWVEGERDQAYNIVKWAEADLGATIVRFRREDLSEKMRQSHSDIGKDETWVEIYG